MKERILEFLRTENKTSSQFAEEIGVQPSGISHIISGRNNPSLDFILKMLEKYPYLSTEWLLFGKGTMYKDMHYGTLFDIPPLTESKQQRSELHRKSDEELIEDSDGDTSEGLKSVDYNSDKSTITKIVWFFGDGTFEEYNKRN